MTRIPATEPAGSPPRTTVRRSEPVRAGLSTVTASFMTGAGPLATMPALHGSGTSPETLSFVPSSPATPGAEPLPPRELEFWLEREAFQMIPPSELEKFEGRYVASVRGRIVESDASLEGLAGKFFTIFGDVPVYMTKVGPEEEERVDTPFE